VWLHQRNSFGRKKVKKSTEAIRNRLFKPRGEGRGSPRKHSRVVLKGLVMEAGG
jgi:hypothetical protein